MLNINLLRKTEHKILVIGSHAPIIQSILDFDFLSGKQEASIQVIVASGRKSERFFFGKKEILIPVYSRLEEIPKKIKNNLTLFLNLSSARRALSFTETIFNEFPLITGGSLFAENVPEKHSLEMYRIAQYHKRFIIGPASVGLLIPGSLKLGAIGGVDSRQLVDSSVFTPGNVAVFSASGGMTNEIIRVVTQNRKRISFSLSFGGDRFPVMTPEEAFLVAEDDEQTEAIVYFGELGGTDEYDIVKLLNEKKITKNVICYIAGSIADLFETPPQFGHAKAMAKNNLETAKAKREALRNAGAHVAGSFTEFVGLIKTLSDFSGEEKEYTMIMDELKNRQHALITTSISRDNDGVPQILGEDLLSFSSQHSFAYIAVSMFLGKKIKSKELEGFVDFVLRILVDHGPYVSGAVNTIIASRAGKDLVSSLSAGLLTIGPRFGGAINEAAQNWLNGVSEDKSTAKFVEEFASRKQYISGIGHRKYRIDNPDPRVKALLKFSEELEKKRFTKFAKEVENVTTAKKGHLILNVDGAIAAVLLDILSEREEVSDAELQRLIDTEFFNALFVISRSVGFISHFLDQKRLDEGLFRLEEDMVAEAKESA